MKDPGLVILGVLAAGFFLVVVPVALTAYARSRSPRVVVCPEASCGASVAVNTRHATVSAVLGQDRLKVASCTLWPARSDCAEACLNDPAFQG